MAAMAAHSIHCYVLLLLTLEISLGLKCPSLIANGDVNMWFSYKFPDERGGTEKFLYRDSATDFKLENGNVADKIVEKLVTGIYTAHNTRVDFKKVEELWEEYKNAKGKKVDAQRAAIAKKIKTEADKLRVYQFWTNDQPNFDPRSIYVPPEDIYGEGKRNNPLFELRQKRPKKWSYAHSKILVSIDMTDGSGFILDHSYPAVPVNLHSEFKDNGAPDPEIFPSAEQRNVFKLGQHAMCVSFPAGGHTAILRALKFMYPRVNTDNFRYYPFWMNNADILSLIKGADSLATGNLCATTWRRKSQADFQRSLGSAADPTPQCTLATDITVGGFTYKIVSHAAVDKIPANLKPTDPAPNLNGLAIGPYPWKEVMATIKTTMFITARWLVSNRVNSIDTNNGFYLVESLKYDTLEPWGTGCEHAKWGVAVPGVGDEWFCAGDTNNENSQITHAGVSICFKDANLRTAMLGMVEKIQWSRYWTELNADPPTHSQGAFAMGGYASTDTKREKRKREEAPAPKQKYERHPKRARNKKEEDAEKEKEEEENEELEIEELHSDTCDGCSACDIEIDDDEEEEGDYYFL